MTISNTARYTFKQSKVREDRTDLNLEDFSIIQDGANYYKYYPDHHQALHANSPADNSTLPTQMKDQTTQLLKNAVKTGTELLDGFDCDVYTRNTPDKKVKMKLWVSRDPRFPFIIKSTELDTDQGITKTFEVKNVQLNVAIPDSEFTLPKGTQFEEIAQSPAPNTQGGGSSAPTQAGAAPTK